MLFNLRNVALLHFLQYWPEETFLDFIELADAPILQPGSIPKLSAALLTHIACYDGWCGDPHGLREAMVHTAAVVKIHPHPPPNHPCPASLHTLPVSVWPGWAIGG